MGNQDKLNLLLKKFELNTCRNNVENVQVAGSVFERQLALQLLAPYKEIFESIIKFEKKNLNMIKRAYIQEYGNGKGGLYGNPW